MDVDARPSPSRRAVLAGLGGAIATFAASALHRLPIARGADGGNFILGQTNGATSTTLLANTSAMNAPTLEVQAQWSSGITSARAIQGDGAGADGVWGMSSGGFGVVGSGQTGVRGMAPTFGIGQPTVGVGAGVAGFNNGSAPAVLGQSIGDATGVQGFSGGSTDTPPAAANDTGVFGAAVGDLGTGVRGKGALTGTSNSAGVIGEGDWGVIGSGTVGALGASDAAGIGLYGSASDAVVPTPYVGAGVTGQSDAGSAVMGVTGTTMVPPVPNTAVYGRGQTGGAAGYGVYGYAPAGTGVFARSTTGYGLRVLGKAAFDRSGKLTVLAGHSSVTKTGIALTSSSLVLATLQTNRAGFTVQAAVPNVAGSSFTIYLNKAVTANTIVAFMVLG